MPRLRRRRATLEQKVMTFLPILQKSRHDILLVVMLPIFAALLRVAFALCALHFAQRLRFERERRRPFFIFHHRLQDLHRCGFRCRRKARFSSCANSIVDGYDLFAEQTESGLPCLFNSTIKELSRRLQAPIPKFFMQPAFRNRRIANLKAAQHVVCRRGAGCI